MSNITESIPPHEPSRQLIEREQHISNEILKTDTLAKYLTFNVNGEIFGTGIEYVKEIIEHGRYTRVPLSQSTIRGVINLRGNVVPVVDLAKRLGYESHAVNKRTCIIIIDMDDEGDHIDLGFVVDAVDEVIDLNNEDIEASPGFGLDIRQDFVAGMGKLKNGEFVKLLDLKTVLSISELSNVGTAGKLDG